MNMGGVGIISVDIKQHAVKMQNISFCAMKRIYHA